VVALAIGGGVAVIATRSRSSGPDGPRGLLGNDATSVVFIQWTETSGGQLSGSVLAVEVANPNQDPYTLTPLSYSLTGIRSGSRVSLTISALSATWTGGLYGSDLALDIPQSDGSLETLTMIPGTADDYNRAADTLRSRVASQKAAADQAAQAKAQQQAAAAQQAQQTQDAAAQRATAAVLAAFRATCTEHGGSLSQTRPDTVGYELPPPDSAGEYCVVSFPGEGSLQVPIRADGTFYQAAADENRAQCASDAQNAALNASSGHPSSKLPDYHAKAGACFQGTP
jgi:hypothetical protein